MLTVFPLYSFTCRRASRLRVCKSFATWGETCLFRLWWKIVSRCLLKMNFKRCLNEKCGWQAVAGKHGRCVLHTGSARETGKIPQTNECLGNTQCYSSFCDRSLTDWGHFWKVPHCWSTLPCTDQWARTSFILIYLKRITFRVMSLMFYQQSFLFFKQSLSSLLFQEASQQNNKQNNRQPWVEINSPVKVWMRRCDRELPRAGLKDRSVRASGLNRPKNILHHQHPATCTRRTQ